MSKIKRRVILVVISVMLSITMTTPAYGYVWYSSSSKVGYYSTTPTASVTYVDGNSTISDSTIRYWLSNTVGKWNVDSDYPTPSTFVYNTDTTANIQIRFGSVESLTENFGIDLVGTNGLVVNGKTYPYKYANSDKTVTVDGATKTVERFSSAYTYIVDKTTAGTYTTSSGTVVSYSQRSQTGMKNTMLHEYGHSLGYHGHSSNTSDVMTTTTSNTTSASITTRDRRQMGQFWNLYYSSGSSSSEISENDEVNITDYYSQLTVEETKSEAIDFLESTLSYVDNIITATPIAITQGSIEILSENEEDCEYLLTEYTFMVTNYLYGSEGDEYITVRSQVGNLFEIGNEYTFATRRINNTLYDLYTVNSRKWVLDNQYLSDNDFASISLAIEAYEATKDTVDAREIIETAEISDYFVNECVDLAIVATIDTIIQDEVNGTYNIKLSDINTLKGSANEYTLQNNLYVKGDISEGETYLMMFTISDNGVVMMASREGSIVSTNSIEFDAYMNILGVM